MDNNAMFRLGYGLYVLSSTLAGRDAGCIINTAVQLTSQPERIMIAVNKSNFTHRAVETSGVFDLSVLTEKTPFAVFRNFGFQSSADAEKFDPNAPRTSNGCAYLAQYANAVISGAVTDSFDLGTHTVFFADVTDAKVLSDARSVTYDYYQNSIKPKKTAQPKKRGYICRVCGYFHEADELPADFVCPVCKHSAADFEPVGFESAAFADISNNTSDKEKTIMKKFVCPVCGYVHEGDVPPEQCPVCKAPASKFVEQKSEMEWADQHVVGVAKGVSDEILEGLRMNFTGECTEVGMYLAMARVAFREGYPEIGMYWEKAAYEEAEHAAKFAELLGEVVTDSTKRNLEMRVEAENGACAGKKQLAALAKEQGLDAIHDTVHEMAKDEARHGCAFAGFLKRYFNK